MVSSSSKNQIKLETIKLEVIPITLREVNDFVKQFHRHNGRTSQDEGKFTIGATTVEELLGVAIVSNPISATYMDGYTAEVLRVCVFSNKQGIILILKAYGKKNKDTDYRNDIFLCQIIKITEEG